MSPPSATRCKRSSSRPSSPQAGPRACWRGSTRRAPDPAIDMGAALLARLRRAAEIVSATLFAAMFFAFVLQVVSRYVFDAPISWTLEVCSIAYIWIVFFAGATIVRPQQHITFDMLYTALPPGWQR